MKIAQIAPLYESVPPKLYGGTERVVSYLTEELVNLGHEVTLFASKDSVTQAKLISTVDKALRLDSTVVDPAAHHIVQLQEVMERADEFDILHFHTDYHHFPVSQTFKKPVITTLHGRFDIPDLQPLYSKFDHQSVVSISDFQATFLPQANWLGTVYHGLPKDQLTPIPSTGNYLAFLGRVSREKRVDRAIEIALKANHKIKIAAKIDANDRQYFENEIEYLFKYSTVDYIGEINENQKTEFLGNAKALLFPIDWPEPFGMVLIEAMACGTPIIAYGKGSVPEIIEDGVTGFVVNSINEAIEAVNKLDQLDRGKVRSIFEQRFSAKRMALDYVNMYEKLIQKDVKKTFTVYRNNTEPSISVGSIK